MKKLFFKGCASLMAGMVMMSSLQVFASSASADTSFDTGIPIGFNSTVNTVAVQNDGKSIFGGNFSTYQGVAAKYIIRLNADGSKDTSFNMGTGFNNSVSTITLQSDGKILVGGSFTTYQGITAKYIIRLNTDGSRDSSFDMGTGFDNAVVPIVVQSDGKIVVGGYFTTYQGVAAKYIIRLNTDGSRDTSFNMGVGFDSFVRTIAVQSDGKILVGGAFTTYQGVSANRIIRLNTDGSKDTSFNMGTGFDNEVRTIAIQSDGGIIVGCAFTTYQGVSANRIIRLNTDGSRDSSFDMGTGFDSSVYSIQLQSDGKILVGGTFTTYQGISAIRIIRLNTDGSRDSSFDMGNGFSNAAVYALALQSDGKILVVGGFNSYQGLLVQYSVRLNTDGSRDSSFNMGTGFDDMITGIIPQSDGKIVVAGWFTTYQGVRANRIIRLNTDGAKDTSFNMGTGFDNKIYIIALQSDGKILVGGAFTTYQGVSANRIIRLNTDGSRDSSFDMGTGFDDSVMIIKTQNDGKIVVGGYFTTYQGVAAKYIIRLNTDGSRDTSFNMGVGFDSFVRTIAVQSDGKILVGGDFFTTYQGVAANRIIRLNTDGSKDTSFNMGTGFNNSVYSIALQSDGKILVGGAFTTYQGVTANRIIRLNTDGSINSSFNGGGGFGSTVYALALQSDGKILIGGQFTNYQGVKAGYLTRLYGDASVVDLPDSNDPAIVNTAFTDEGYILDPGGDLIGSDPISLAATDGSIPINLSLRNIDITMKLDANTQIQKADTTNYNGLLSVATTRTISSVNDEPVIKAFKVGSISEQLIIDSGSTTLSIPVTGQNIGQYIQVYNAQDNGVSWYPETVTQVIDKDGVPTVEFTTNSFGDFALTEVPDTIPPTASVMYSTTGATNQDVIATLTGASESLTNINTSTYTFTGNGTFTFTFEDLAGNTGSVTATVNNIDKTVPIISLLGEPSMNIVQGSIYIDSGATALDNIDGDISANIIISGTVNTAITGTYVISYKVNDSAGNTATEATRYVTVLQKDAPLASVNYSITGTTTQNVIATITGFSEAITGLNATGHTFTENGTFTFVFQDLFGNPGSITATVTWITKHNGGGISRYSPITNIINKVVETIKGPAEKVGSIKDSRYPTESNNAYLWAYKMGITTQASIQDANLDGKLYRSHLAKMISEYAVKQLKKTANTGAKCEFADMNNQSTEMKVYAQAACQLGLMGLKSDGTPDTKFNPTAEVTRAQFGTTLSRLLYGASNNEKVGGERYTSHLNALKAAGIMTKIEKPTMDELRGNVFLMLMRTVK